MYTDDTILTWGRYKFTALKRIPASWLLSKHKSKGIHDMVLVEWVADNFERLKEREEREKKGEKPEELPLPCTKNTYSSEEQAKKHLKEIRRYAESHEQKNHIPVRAYPCPFCKGWHLSSRP